MTRSLPALLLAFAALFVTGTACADATEGPSVVNPEATFAALPARCQGQVAACKVINAGRRSPVVVAWGDSHLAQQLPAIMSEARGARSSLTVFTLGGCAAHIARGTSDCDLMAAKALTYVEAMNRKGRRVTVVLGAYWDLYRTSPTYAPRAATAELFKRVSRVARVGAIAPQPVAVGCDMTLAVCPRATMLPNEAEVRGWLIAQGARLIDTTGSTCDVTVCVIDHVYDEVGDGYHMNIGLSLRSASAFDWAFAH